MLTVQYGYSPDRSTVTNSVANLGAIFGGMVFGHLSTFIGRRLAIIIACILGGAMIYPWAFIKGSGINAGVFFLQAGVQGAWGVIPIHLSELSPPEYRSFVAGCAYQLGNLCSSASSTIEATIGQRFPLKGVEGDVYDYAKVMAIFIACVFTYVILIVFFGPENRGASMGVERDEYLEEIDDDKSIEDSLDDRDTKPHSKHHEVAA
jgi:SHS family lactate transporter-like MFS transporter